RPEQLRTATLIALLRRGAMPLVEIRAFLRDPSLERLTEYERRVGGEFEERRRVLRYVKRILKEEPLYDVFTKHIDEQAYVSRSKRVRFPELDSLIPATFRKLGWPAEGSPFVLYHGPVNTEEDGPIEVCVPRLDGDKRLSAGDVAFTEVSGRQCDFPELLGGYEAVYRWAKEHGRDPDGPPRDLSEWPGGGVAHRDRRAAPLTAKIAPCTLRSSAPGSWALRPRVRWRATG